MRYSDLLKKYGRAVTVETNASGRETVKYNKSIIQGKSYISTKCFAAIAKVNAAANKYFLQNPNIMDQVNGRFMMYSDIEKSRADYKYISYSNESNLFEYRYACNEVDIKAAYPTAAYHLGVIDKKLYDYCMENLTKRERLLTFGSIATSKDVVKYEGQIIRDRFSTKKKTAPVFFLLAEYIAEHMKIISQQNKSLFYWFDAAFLPRDYAQSAVNELKHFDFQSKNVPLEKILFIEGKRPIIKVVDSINSVQCDYREFPYSPVTGKIKNNVAKYRINDTNKPVFLQH